MYQRFFEAEKEYVGYFKFEDDPERVPGHIVIKGNNIEGQLYRAPKDIIENPDLPLGLGINTKKTLNATGVFRLKDGKDYEVSLSKIQITSWSTSRLGFFGIYCRMILVNRTIFDLDNLKVEKLIVNIRGLEQWFEDKIVDYIEEGNSQIIKIGDRIVDPIFDSEDINVGIECYANLLAGERQKTIDEKVSLVVSFKKAVLFKIAESYPNKLRQLISLIYKKHLPIEELSFMESVESQECYVIYSDNRDFLRGK